MNNFRWFLWQLLQIVWVSIFLKIDIDKNYYLLSFVCSKYLLSEKIYILDVTSIIWELLQIVWVSSFLKNKCFQNSMEFHWNSNRYWQKLLFIYFPSYWPKHFKIWKNIYLGSYVDFLTTSSNCLSFIFSKSSSVS